MCGGAAARCKKEGVKNGQIWLLYASQGLSYACQPGSTYTANQMSNRCVSRMQPRNLSLGNRLVRMGWQFVWVLLFRLTPRPFFAWRRLLLRLFGAEMGPGAHVYPSARIWAPWNLRMMEGSCLASWVDCYNVDEVFLGPGAIVSQHSKLLTASHDYLDPSFQLVTAPIRLGANAWVTADVLVCPGVEFGEGAVALAGSVVTKSVAPWQVVAGNPARIIRSRPSSAVRVEEHADNAARRSEACPKS
jgi:putative colanic acid biosynthesis acetyltransferase WcaF